MKNVLTVMVAAVMLAAQPAGILASQGQTQAGTVKVTVTYKGKAGQVDASHKLWVWLFDNPNIGPGSQPIDQIALDKNGADAVFQVSTGAVYVAVAFDEKGGMDGQGPPPPGTPISILADAKGVPVAVTPGPKAAISLTFDDTVRMP